MATGEKLFRLHRTPVPGPQILGDEKVSARPIYSWGKLGTKKQSDSQAKDF